MQPLIWLIAIVVFVVLLALWVRRRTDKDARTTGHGMSNDEFVDAVTRTDTTFSGDPRRLKIGDAVTVREMAFVVLGYLVFKEEGETWTEFNLGTYNGFEYWLSFEGSHVLEVDLWRRVSQADVDFAINDSEADRKLVFGDNTFRLHEDGGATFVSYGETGLDASGRMAYRDYTGPTGKLGLERFGRGSWYIYEGESLNPETGEFRIDHQEQNS